MSKFSTAAMAAASLLFAAGAASAGQVTSSFTVSVTVDAGCVINAGPGNIVFPTTVGTATKPVDQISSAKVVCTDTTPYKVYFTSTNNPGGTTFSMKNGTKSIPYSIASGATLIGNTNAAGLSQTGNGGEQTIPLTFSILTSGWNPGVVAPATGTFTDSVTLTVDF